MTKLKTTLEPEDLCSDLNALQYVISKSIRDTVNTMLIVKVVKVKETTIDVQTIIQDIDSSKEPIGNYIIEDVRYIKWQYGVNCIKATPAIGDIGLLIVSQQDTSGLAYLDDNGETKSSTRSQYNIGDGIYIGGLYGLNTTPTEYIDFTSNGITITSTSAITVNAPTVNLGGTGGVGVARIGDTVDLSTGKITGGSTNVKAV